jgi:hypothetical protein
VSIYCRNIPYFIQLAIFNNIRFGTFITMVSLDVSAYSYDISMVFCCNSYCWWNYSEIFPYATCLLGNDSQKRKEYIAN